MGVTVAHACYFARKPKRKGQEMTLKETLIAEYEGVSREEILEELLQSRAIFTVLYNAILDMRITLVKADKILDRAHESVINGYDFEEPI